MIRRFYFILLAFLFPFSLPTIAASQSGYVGDYVDLKVSVSASEIYSIEWKEWSGSTDCVTLTQNWGNDATVHIDSYFTGTVRIRAQYKNMSNAIKTEYFDITCNAVTLTPSPASLSMKVDDKDYINYNSSPYGKWPSVSYSSSNKNVASVDYSSGLVTAKAKGYATITLSNSMGPSVTVGVSVEGGKDDDDSGGGDSGGGTTIKDGDWFQEETIEGYNMLFCAYTDAYTGELCCTVTSSLQGISTITHANGKVTIPSYPKGVKVTKINNNAFHDLDGMTELIIPSTVAYIGPSICNSCPNLTKLTCEATTPPSAYSDSFGWRLRSGTLYVPKGCVSKYQAAKGWKEFNNIKDIGSADDVLVSSITLNETSITLNEGASMQLSATISPNNATNKNVTWNSSDTSVATVSNSGLVTAKAAGSATITCKAADSSGEQATCSVTVKAAAIEPTDITISPLSRTITVGESFYASYTLTPSNATTTVTWSSDNTSIATVTQTGQVKGVGEGYTYINVTTANGKTSWFKITVNAATVYVTSISLNAYSATLFVGESKQLSATVSPSNATNKSLTWSSSNINVATVSSSGLVKAKSTGSVTIICKANDGSGVSESCYIKVSGSNIIEINSTTFPDAKFRNWMLEQDYGKDGKLTESEIKNVTSINVRDRDITTLKGIEYFTSLTSLNCGINPLTSLDVSKNTALETLNCYNNQLTSLDVSKNTALTSLSCYSNQLTSLDVSKNTALTSLSCYSNQLTFLDVSKNTALTYLDCGINPLTSLDLSKNTALTALSCFYNQLTSLELSKNTALKYLYCYSNQLTTLDVSKNTALQFLSCYRNQIKGKAMDDLISSLPYHSSDEIYKFRVISPSDDEGNVCTKSQVAAAKAKGWTPLYYNGTEWMEYEGSDDLVEPTSISLPYSETVEIGKTITLTYTLKPENATTTLTWTSDDTRIATVSSSGVVKGISTGETKIRVKTANGKTDNCTIHVAGPPTDIYTRESLSMALGDTCKMSYGLTPYYAKATVTWSSENTAVATVGANSGKVTAVGVGSTNIVATTDNGKSCKCPITVIAETAMMRADIKQVAAGGSHSMILKTDGSLWTCGSNSSGKLGDGTTNDSSTPIKVMDGVASVAASNSHSMILKTDGSLWACGDNLHGQLGDGTHTKKSTPVKVMDGVASVAAGGSHSMILKTDGSLWACGYNYYGQLGDGTTNDSSTPIEVMDGVASVAASNSHSMILKTDGSLWACGDNLHGQLGDGTHTKKSTPVKVMDGVASVAAGGSHSMILKTDGSLWACGYNYYGQLGDGTTETKLTPVKVMDGVASVAAGNSHSMILKTDGSLWACGYNYHGQLGDGTTTEKSTPIKVMDGVASVAAGSSHSMILKSDGSLWACGYNNYGQLADGTNIDRQTPIMIGKLVEDFAQGDVNMDNAVNGTDLVALSNIVLGRKEKTVAADVNGDGNVNGTDIVALSNIILGRNNNARSRAPETGASLSIEPFDIKAGETKELLIDLTNPNDEMTLVQFDLHLPVGLSIKKNGSDLDFDMAGRTSWRKHTLDANEVDDAYRFLLYSSGNTLIEGTNGAIIKVNIVADETFNGGKIVLDNILLVDPNEKETKPEIFEYVIPTLDDGSAKLSVEPFDIAKGETKNMLIDLSNPNDEVTLVQFDMYLPVGLSIKKNSSDLDFDIAGRTSWRKHTLDANEKDGAYRFLLYSSGNTLIEGTSGAIIKMSVVADESFNGGKIVLDNILLVDPNEKEMKPARCEYEIGSGSGISSVKIDTIGKRAHIYNLSGQKLSAPKKGINIIGGKKVVVK